jgi:hypothetical protein
MKYMSWGWDDLMDLPADYYPVLVDMLNAAVKDK